MAEDVRRLHVPPGSRSKGPQPIYFGHSMFQSLDRIAAQCQSHHSLVHVLFLTSPSPPACLSRPILLVLPKRVLCLGPLAMVSICLWVPIHPQYLRHALHLNRSVLDRWLEMEV